MRFLPDSDRCGAGVRLRLGEDRDPHPHATRHRVGDGRAVRAFARHGPPRFLIGTKSGPQQRRSGSSRGPEDVVVGGDQLVAQHVRVDPALLGHPACGHLHPARLVAPAGRAGWRQIGRVGLDQQPLRRGRAGRPLRSAPPPPGTRGPRCSRHSRSRDMPRRSRPGPENEWSTAAGRPAKRSVQAAPPTPASASSRTRMSWASRSPLRRSAMEDERLARLECELDVPAEVVQLDISRATWLRSWSRPVSPMARPRARTPASAQQVAIAGSHTRQRRGDGPRPRYPRPVSAASSMPATDVATSQPGASSRSTPAARAAASTSAASAAKASAWR